MRHFLEYRRGPFRVVASYATPTQRDAVAAELLMHGGAVTTYAKVVAQ